MPPKPPQPSRGASNGGAVRKVWIGGFTANAFGNGVSMSLGEVHTRVLNCCFGAAIAWTLMVACRAVNPSETTHCVGMCQNVSERVRAIGYRRQRLVETPFAGSAEGQQGG